MSWKQQFHLLSLFTIVNDNGIIIARWNQRFTVQREIHGIDAVFVHREWFGHVELLHGVLSEFDFWSHLEGFERRWTTRSKNEVKILFTINRTENEHHRRSSEVDLPLLILYNYKHVYISWIRLSRSVWYHSSEEKVWRIISNVIHTLQILFCVTGW